MQLQDGTFESEKELSKKYSYFDYPIEGMCLEWLRCCKGNSTDPTWRESNAL